MRLVAVDITPEGHLVTVGGRNGAGKSSVLRSIAVALGGMQLAPEEPIRTGEHQASVFVDLGDLRVTRRFHRSRLTCDCKKDDDLRLDDPHAESCASHKWSDVESTLTVTNADGTAKYNSPQTMLDKLLGRLTFDPLTFLKDAKQGYTLAKLVGVDVAEFAARRNAAVAERTAAKRRYEAESAVVQIMPRHPDTPSKEIPMKEISDEMLRAEEYRRLAEEAAREVDRAKDGVTIANDQLSRLRTKRESLEHQLAELKNEEILKIAAAEDAGKTLDARRITAEAAKAVVPDSTAIREKLAEAEAVNQRVRTNRKRLEAEGKLLGLADEVEKHSAAVVAIDEERTNALRSAKFPVPGLGIAEDGDVLFNGIPLQQASSAEQLRVSVAIGLALNPSLKILLLRNGNVLDQDSLAAVAQQAEAADAQVWVEWVTTDAKDVSVMIEDGSTVHGQA